MPKYSQWICNQCYRRLTEKRLSTYTLTWLYSGDIYCNRCDPKRPIEQKEKKR